VGRAAIEAFVAANSLGSVFEAYPASEGFFSCVRVDRVDAAMGLAGFLEMLPSLYLEDFGFTRASLAREFIDYLGAADEAAARKAPAAREIAVLGGIDKSGAAECLGFTAAAGEIVAVVGATGSGKSRLLADIECLAQGDTPTRRTVLLDGRRPEEGERFDAARRLVAQISQNMNFVLDLPVGDFLRMHASARGSPDPEGAAREIFERANGLSGERFGLHTKATQLSGGQSRALMVADAALLSDSPVVLIDELENAGIDRRLALGLLAKGDKIVLMSTHDPLLALMADRRVVIRNGGIAEVIEAGGAERRNLAAIEDFDFRMSELRAAVRAGRRIDFDARAYLRGEAGADN
jgi:ABC-type lipoprotein export system ATPase subunit